MEHEKQILAEIKALGGKLYRVGGCVRDSFLGVTPKDIDYLVTGLELSEIHDIVSKFGKANEVGKSFGIITYLKDRKYLEILFQLFRIIKPSKTLEISRLMRLPLFPKDLPIDGTELMSMGLAGPAIGKAQKEMLTLIFQGKMESTREDVLYFLSK